MSKLALVLALAASAPTLAHARDASRDAVSCSVDVGAFDSLGRLRPARRVSASVAPVVVFRGSVSKQDDETPTPPLLFDVFNPRGQRYQVLVANPLVITKERRGRRVKRVSRFREATLAVAGSSIAWTSMYGRWRVEPRIEGTQRRCGRPEFFTIRQ